MKLFWMFVACLVYMLAVIGAVWVGVSLSDRSQPITYEGARALAETVPQGGSIDVEYKVYRSRLCVAVARRYLVDAQGEKHSIPSYTVGLSSFVGRETYIRTITIPEASAPGPADYQVSLDYYCNPFHRLGFPIKVRAPDIHFQITPDTGLVPFANPAAR